MKVWIVDSFTDRPYCGNPAGIAVVDDFPTDASCQNIAAEINLSETGFIKPLGPNHFHIRWFSPTQEVPLCGHVTLAASHILQQEKCIDSNKPIHFDSLSGVLISSIKPEGIELNFPLQPVSQALDPVLFQSFIPGPIIASVLAIDCAIVELPTAEAVKHFIPDFTAIASLPQRGLIITAQDKSGSYDFISRFFVPKIGINEDPVTGSAHCKLADYWQHKLNKRTFLAYQASRRGGKIHVTIENNRVLLTGQAVTVMQGKWCF